MTNNCTEITRSDAFRDFHVFPVASLYEIQSSHSLLISHQETFLHWLRIFRSELLPFFVQSTQKTSTMGRGVEKHSEIQFEKDRTIFNNEIFFDILQACGK